MKDNRNKYLEGLKEIQDMVSHIRIMKENVNFEEEYDDEYAGEFDEPSVNSEEPEGQDVKSLEDKGMEELDEMGELDEIRAITLDGMRKLSSKPESPQFQALNKIFQICNKSVEKNTEDMGD